MTNPTPDIRALREVIGQMDQRDRSWQQELAGYQQADGDIRDESLPAYEYAKDQAGWDLVEILPEWIKVLTSALGAVEAGERTHSAQHTILVSGDGPC